MIDTLLSVMRKHLKKSIEDYLVILTKMFPNFLVCELWTIDCYQYFPKKYLSKELIENIKIKDLKIVSM